MKPGILTRFAIALVTLLSTFSTHAQEARWWKGNIHTHSLWSDGDGYPEMIADWYKKHDYNFLMLSDHNVMQEGPRWLVATNKGGGKVLEEYVKRFGNKWVEQRTRNGLPEVRLKTLAEFRPLFEESGRFLFIPGEELTDRYKIAPVHMGAVNLRTVIKPQGGDSVLEVLQHNVDAVLAQEKATGQPMFPHVNHPNFRWGITAEELMQVRGLRFFEVYNGHPQVFNEGDALHAGIDKVWDICLTHRLTDLDLGVLYGLATDDSHHYHKIGLGNSNSGRGWVMVRAKDLSINSIIAAMEAGDFYASSGVTLKDVTREGDELKVEVKPETGVEYTIEFIGTRRGFDPHDEPVRTANGEKLRVTHHYSSDIGAVLSKVSGTSASYRLKGDEIYVRAKITSTKLKSNPYREGEFEQAWTQPLVNPK